jgi:dsRNA-specific ribonuclease
MGATRLMEILEGLGPLLPEGPADPRIQQALTRRGWNLEQGMPGAAHHEPLEWLGDRILGAVVARELWQRFPGADPKGLNPAYDQLCCATTLAGLAREVGLAASLRASRGEVVQSQLDSDGVLHSHMEALIAGVFLAGGWPAAERLVLLLLDEHVPSELAEPGAAARRDEPVDNPMGELNERVQGRWQRNLDKRNDWNTERVGGTDNVPLHRAELWLPDGSHHVGPDVQGPAKEARAAAARVALAYLDAEYGRM